MALREVRELYSGVRIDVDDMTLTEFGPDDCEVYSLWDILKRWNGIDGVQIEIKRLYPVYEGVDSD